MKFPDNSKVRYYWHKIKSASKAIAIIDYDTFLKVMNLPDQEVFFFKSGLVRFADIQEGFMARMHSYIFGHKFFNELSAFKFILGEFMKEHELHRIECTVDKENKGLQQILEMLQFKKEGVAINGIYINGDCRDGRVFGYIR